VVLELFKFYITPTDSFRDAFPLEECFSSSNKTTFVLKSDVEQVSLSFFRVLPHSSNLELNLSDKFFNSNSDKDKLGTLTSISYMVSLWSLFKGELVMGEEQLYKRVNF
jgi:hypothetical protein